MDFDYKKIKLDFRSIANSDTALTISVAPRFKYENGKRTDIQEGFSYTLVLPNNDYSKIVIKTDEEKAAFTQEDIIAKGGAIKSKPKGFEARLYSNANSGIGLIATAITMEVVQ